MMDQVMRSSIQLLKARAGAAGLNFWDILELGLEVRVALDYLSNAPTPSPPAPPVLIPNGPGSAWNIVVNKVSASQTATSAAIAVPPIPAPAPPPTVDLLYEKALGFTNTENTILTVWLGLAIKGDVALAGDVLRAGLLAEHYASLLHEDPAQVSPAQSDRLTALLNIARDLVAQANRQLQSGYKV